MSRDIIIQDIPAGVESVKDIPDGWMPEPLPYRQTDVIAAVVEVDPGADISDPSWLRVDLPGVSVEVNVRDDDPLMGFALHIRGEIAASNDFVSRLLEKLGLRAFDPWSDSGIFGGN